jgi:hypothetical protein
MPDELVDYEAGDVTAEERERIQEHLALCPSCAQAVLEVGPLPAVQMSERAVDEAWTRFSARSGARPDRRRSALVPWSAAAALFLVVAGLAVEVGRLRETAGSEDGAQIVDLLPVGEDVQRSGGGEEAVEAPAWVGRLVLILNLTHEPVLPAYAVRITAVDGREIWRGGEQRPGADGTLTLIVPRRLLPAGEYRIGLYGSGAPVSEYALRLRS